LDVLKPQKFVVCTQWARAHILRSVCAVMADAVQSDVSRPSALPTANLLYPKSSNNLRHQQTQDRNSAQYLDDIEEEWNKKVDVEIETLVDGLNVEYNFLGLEIGDKDKFRVAQEAFQTQCRAESMIKASNSMLSVIHSMKLLLLLSDESQIANRRDTELKTVQVEKEQTKQQVATLLDELLSKRSDV